MRQHHISVEVLGPWSLATSKMFWEGFAPATLTAQERKTQLHSVFRVDKDWSRAEVWVRQNGNTALIEVHGDGDLDAAAAQTCRFLSLDIDATDWPAVGRRDPVIADAQRQLPGLRPCGFHSPYEAAAWAVISQRIRITQAAKARDRIVALHGDNGAFPTPHKLRTLDLELDLPGRKTEYLHAVADAALDGLLDGATLRSVNPEEAIDQVRQIKGLGPFASELVVIRGANAPDALPHHERRLDAEVEYRYGKPLADVALAWKPFRTWAAVHLRTLREQRTHEISGIPETPTA